MEFTDLIALKIKELMKEKELSIYKLEYKYILLL